MTTLPRFYYYSPLLLLLLLLRPSLDPVFDALKLGSMGPGALVNVFMLLVLFVILIHQKFSLNAISKYWLPLLAMMAVGAIYTPEPSKAVRSLLVVVTYMAMFLLPFHFIKTKAHFIECLKLIVYSAFIPLVAVLYEFVFPAGSTNQHGFRLFSTFSHPNVFAFYLVTIVSVCFFVIKSRLFDEEMQFRRLCWFVLVISLLCILGTKTRSAWAVIALLALIYGLFEERKYLLYLCFAAAIAISIPSIQDRVFDLFQGNDPDALLENYEALNSYAWRKVIWAGAMEKFWDQAIFGFGYESFTYFSGAFFIIESETGMGAHNTYVQVLFELGIVGFLAFLWLLVPLCYKLWKLDKRRAENVIVFGLFLSYCLIHYSDNVFDYLVFNWYFWFFIGAILSINQVLKENTKELSNLVHKI